MSTEIRLSQHTAILIEHAKRAGMSEQSLLHAVQSNDISAFEQVKEEHYNYTDLFTYSVEHGEKLAEAITGGYRITFNTRNGLKIWLEKFLGQDSERDFQVGEGIIEGLLVNEQQAGVIHQRLAANWIVAESKEVMNGKELTLKLRAPEVII